MIEVVRRKTFALMLFLHHLYKLIAQCLLDNRGGKQLMENRPDVGLYDVHINIWLRGDIY